MNHHVITIGTSAGGVKALKTILQSLPEDFPASIHIVQHISGETSSKLPLVLNKVSKLKAAFAQDGELILPHRVYIAPPDYHLLLQGNRHRVVRGPRENRMRPAVDPLFRSAAVTYRSYATGIILTGMLDDGTAGLGAIKACGGMAIVQDPKEAIYPSMPESAIANVAVDRIVTLKEIPAILCQRIREKPVVVTEIPEDLLLEVAIPQDAITAPETMAKIGTPVTHSCPSCGGPLWQIGDRQNLRYRCHVGHAYTVRTLVEKQSEATEEALWVALRTLEERSRMLKNMSDRYAENGSSVLAESHLERSQEAFEYSILIRDLIRNLKSY